GLAKRRQRTSAIHASVPSTAIATADTDTKASYPRVWRAILWEICSGQPACSAIQPNQTVAQASEKHITANQSSELTTPRRKVGSENAASPPAGTARRLYSQAQASARKSITPTGHRMNSSGIQMCGPNSQVRQRQIASRARRQVGHRNQGRPRKMLR